MFHQQEQIKCYKSATKMIISIKEAIYIIWIQDFIKLINIKKIYGKQILDHNPEKFSLIIRKTINMFFSSKTLTKVHKNAVL